MIIEKYWKKPKKVEKNVRYALLIQKFVI